MSRYIIRAPRSDWYDSDYPLSVPDPKEVDTGLLDAKGEKLFRVQPPVGFGRDFEW